MAKRAAGKGGLAEDALRGLSARLWPFCFYGGHPNGELVDRVTVNHRDIAFDDDGSLDIRFGRNPKGINEFSIDPDPVSLFTREYFLRPRRIAGERSQHRKRPPAATRDAPRRHPACAAHPQHGDVLPVHDVDRAAAREFPDNEFCPPFEFDAEQGGWGTVDNIYCFSRFRLEEPVPEDHVPVAPRLAEKGNNVSIRVTD